MKDNTPAWFTHTSFGTWDPEGCLVSVIDDLAVAVRAVAALQLAGFTTRLFLAAELLEFSAGMRRRQGILRRTLFSVTNWSDATDFQAEYREEARLGHHILVVHAPKREQRAVARARMRQYRAHTLKYYGFWVVTVLD